MFKEDLSDPLDTLELLVPFALLPLPTRISGCEATGCAAAGAGGGAGAGGAGANGGGLGGLGALGAPIHMVLYLHCLVF